MVHWPYYCSWWLLFPVADDPSLQLGKQVRHFRFIFTENKQKMPKSPRTSTPGERKALRSKVWSEESLCSYLGKVSRQWKFTTLHHEILSNFGFYWIFTEEFFASAAIPIPIVWPSLSLCKTIIANIICQCQLNIKFEPSKMLCPWELINIFIPSLIWFHSIRIIDFQRRIFLPFRATLL